MGGFFASADCKGVRSYRRRADSGQLIADGGWRKKKITLRRRMRGADAEKAGGRTPPPGVLPKSVEVIDCTGVAEMLGAEECGRIGK
jgi:hypothetical protein